MCCSPSLVLKFTDLFPIAMRLVVYGARRAFLRGLHRTTTNLHRSDIDLFNKSKKEYLFGHNFSSVDEIAGAERPTLESNTNDLHERLGDIHAQVARDPRLKDMDPNSADYKYQFLLIAREEQEKLINRNKKLFEFNERMKGVGLGIALLVLAIGGHQVFMNYEYLKNSLLHGYWYDIEEKVGQEPPNRKSTKYLTEKVQQQLTDEFVAGIKPSSEPGIYIFGAINNRRLPTRILYFDGMKVDDVSVARDYAVVISNGKLYQWSPKMDTPQSTRMPFKATKCHVSDNFIYFLTTKGQVAYTPRADTRVEFQPQATRNWLGLTVKQNFNYLSFDSLASGEKIADVSFGKSHLLALTNKGRLYVGATESVANYGQFGLPSLSPFAKDKANLALFETKEMPLLNNEVIHKKKKAVLSPRRFTSIATGDFHNVAVDSTGTIWAWGKNNHGQCGKETSYQSELQPIPSPIGFSKSMLKGGKVTKVFADGSTSFAQVNGDGNVHLLAFGDGVKGQLGINRFMHICSVPQSVKVVGTLTEFDETENEVVGIGIKDVSVGASHTFVTLDNIGDKKDVLAFGDNEFGQLGNGKRIRSSKPINLPLLIEPEEVNGDNRKSQAEALAKRFSELTTKRLQLQVGQAIRAGEESSAIFTKR